VERWEPWHFGYTRGPPPCSEAGNSIAGGGDGESASAGGLPSFVPSRYREPILRAAARWNVSAGLIAAQIMAESNFNPNAVSPAGAQGIAQFMPGTAASYGLDDPFDAEQAINAQAHLMSDLLRQFNSIPLALAAYNAGPGAVAGCDCVPPYPETQAYVARILGLLDGAGELSAPPLEVRLVSSRLPRVSVRRLHGQAHPLLLIAQWGSSDNIAAARMSCSGEAFSIPGIERSTRRWQRSRD
jgi:hypothetical protein